MKKTEVYVVVDTPKKAKKLKKVLDMFGENAYPNIEIPFRNNFLYFDSEGFYDTAMYKNGVYTKNKTEVSIKELRNILAKEHLRHGDIVITSSFEGKYKSILKIKGLEGDYLKVDKQVFIKGSDAIHTDGQEHIKDFIRYATEEEKALLEPNKELEVGKWYKGNVDIESLIFITEIENVKYYNRIHGYGFIGGKWDDTGHLFSNTDHEKSLVEATYEEVKQALIEEANRLGHNYDKYSYDPDENNLCGYNGRLEEVFVDGVWNEPYDKLSNLKEAYDNGYCIEFYDEKTDTWERHENPCWNTDLQWCIMVNNGHLVISDVYLSNQIKNLKKSIEEIKSNIK